MSYESIEAALKAQLEALPRFKGRVSIDGPKQLNSGSMPSIELRYGGFENERDAFQGEFHTSWLVSIILYIRYTNATDVRKGLRAGREDILQRIGAYPRLGGADGVFDAMILRGRPEPSEVMVGSVKARSEEIICRIVEEVSIQPAE